MAGWIVVGRLVVGLVELKLFSGWLVVVSLIDGWWGNGCLKLVCGRLVGWFDRWLVSGWMVSCGLDEVGWIVGQAVDWWVLVG